MAIHRELINRSASEVGAMIELGRAKTIFLGRYPARPRPATPDHDALNFNEPWNRDVRIQTVFQYPREELGIAVQRTPNRLLCVPTRARAPRTATSHISPRSKPTLALPFT